VTIRVLIVDDSAVVRQILTRVLSADPEVVVVGAAPDPFVARDMIVTLKPDVMTLDVEMPRMDGITFLQKLMQYHPIPTIILSSLTPEGSQACLAAFAAGAVDVLSKPHGAYTLNDVAADLVLKVKMAASARVQKLTAPTAKVGVLAPLASSQATHQILAIGASTGGTRALEYLFERLPADMPGTVVVQHMPEGFTKSFADRLNTLSAMRVKEAENGDALTPGLALIAKGNVHMVLHRSGAVYQVELKDGPRVSYNRPAVDVLFTSVARAAGKNAVGVILTGMGSDGAEGLLAMKKAGASTLAQDEASSVVFGMPKVAIEIGAVDTVVSIEQMPRAILRTLRSRS